MNVSESTKVKTEKDFGALERQFSSGVGKGVHMKKFKPYVDFVLNHLVKRGEIINGEALLPMDGRPVVAFTSHGPGVAWMPLVALVGKFFIDNGYGDVVGGMYPHKAVFLVPGLKGYYKRVLGTPTEVSTVDDLVHLFKNNEISFTGTAPEGAHCLLSFDEYVAPFRSKGMIVAAIKADTSICLMAHQGAETWNIRLNLPFGWTLPFSKGIKGVNIPLFPYKKLPDYMVLCRRYKPAITSEDLAKMSKREARLQINVEAERIRAELNMMTDEVKALMRAQSNKDKPKTPVRMDSWQQRRIQIRNGLFPLDEAYG